MIKNNYCEVQITKRNKKYYIKSGYFCDVGDLITIDIDKMPKKSHNLVIAICEICNTEIELEFLKYNNNIERGGFYSCKKCSNIKRKKTLLEKHGVECIFQLDSIKESNKIWMSSDEFKNKSRSTQMVKYGCLFVQTDDFIEENSKSQVESIRIKKQNGEYLCSLSLPENKEKREKGMFEKYGHTYSFHVNSIKNRIQETNLEKFGHISPFGNEKVQKKIKMNIIYKNSEKETNFNGDVYKSNLFKVYRRKVRYETNLIKKRLFENWDGYDYYDREFIKNNFYLNRNHKNYPTIDHKISCLYGFLNNLDTKEISNIVNLCITKRHLNNKKNYLIEEDFLKIMNNQNF